MILEKQTENLELNDGVSQESFVTEIDFDSADFLKQMLSKFYADAIGSLIRETASNALDSHREMGIDEPIIVSLITNNSGNLEFSVEDFGVGVDKDTINNILRKYGKSTKRNSVNQLGAFGLGWKSPLAYTSSFTFIGRKNGVETGCIMYEGEEDIKIDILYEKPTKERNGCKVVVPVKRNDEWEFRKKIESQLAYFENVYFNVRNIENNFTIHRAKNFQYSDLCSDTSMHICLDNVYYPLDYNKLGIRNIHIGVGLRFSLTDGLFPTPNRESLKYTEDAKAIIKAKIQQVANDLVNMYNENTVDNEDIFKLIEHYSYSQRYVPINKDVSLEIRELVDTWATDKIVEPALPNLSVLSTEFLLKTLKNSFLMEYETEYELSNGRLSQNKHFRGLDINHFKTNSYIRYLFKDRFGGIKKEYIRYLHGIDTKPNLFIKKKEYFCLKPFDNILKEGNLYNILGLKTIPKNQWRGAIKDFFYVRDLIIKDKLIDLDALEVPQDYLDQRKARLSARAVKLKEVKQLGEVVAKLAMDTEKYTSNYCKYESFNLKLQDLHKQPIVYIYGLDEDKDKMSQLFSLLKGKNKERYKIITFSNREYKKVEQFKMHNLISIDKFMKGDTSLFSKIATAHIILDLKSQHRHTFDTTGFRLLDLVSKELSDKIKKLDDYADMYGKRGDATLVKTIVDLAEANDLFDNEVYNDYLEVKKLLEKLYFLENFVCSIRGFYYNLNNENTQVRALVDLFKYHKVKVNMDWYTVPNKVEIELLNELENA